MLQRRSKKSFRLLKKLERGQRSMVERKKVLAMLSIALSTSLILYLHWATVREIHGLRSIYMELHFIPLLVGAVVFGLRGALFTFLFVSALYLTYFFIASWTGSFLSLAESSVHLLFSGASAFLVGFLVDRERRHQRQSEMERYLAGLGQAAATIVHDLRNPLVTISSVAKRIQDDKEEAKTGAQTISESVRKMERVISGALDFSRPLRLTLENTDIRDLIQHVCEVCHAKAEQTGVNLVANLPAEPVMGEVDIFYMERALVNLVDNAMEASNTDQDVQISVSNQKAEFVIRVKDHGHGMDKETLQHMFIPFYSRKSKGTGLGMAIVKKIIEEHTGRITVRSRPGSGTKIKVTLPRLAPVRAQTEEQKRRVL
jgi:signal transduction histidine kinase